MQKPTLAAETRLACAVPVWAGRFYLRHLGLVVGISLIPAAQRAVSQLWAAQAPLASGAIGELVTAAARVALFVLVFRLAITGEERLRGLDGREGMRRIGHFARGHWRSLIVQLVLFVLVFIVFDRIPDAVIAPRVPESARPVYWAVLLFIKNPTIIAFTLIWEIGILRQMLLIPALPPEAPHTPTRYPATR